MANYRTVKTMEKLKIFEQNCAKLKFAHTKKLNREQLQHRIIKNNSSQFHIK